MTVRKQCNTHTQGSGCYRIIRKGKESLGYEIHELPGQKVTVAVFKLVKTERLVWNEINVMGQ